LFKAQRNLWIRLGDKSPSKEDPPSWPLLAKLATVSQVYKSIYWVS